jgi:hypothetical protein
MMLGGMICLNEAAHGFATFMGPNRRTIVFLSPWYSEAKSTPHDDPGSPWEDKCIARLHDACDRRHARQGNRTSSVRGCFFITFITSLHSNFCARTKALTGMLGF